MKRPLSFGMTMLASALGVVLVSVVCGLLMFVMMIAMVASISTMGDSDAVEVKKATFLTLDLDRIGGDRTADRFTLAFGDGNSLGLVDATAAIRRAATDSRVAGILLKDGGSPAVSWGSLKELRDALASFRESGKPVVAFATGYSQGGYYVASLADRLCLHPAGMVDFRGLGAEVMYYKELLDKLGVEMQLIRPESCAYKSAGEVYTLDHMSAANREQIRTYIASIWRTATAEIADSRSMDVARLNRVADNLGGYLAYDARTSGLVDTLCFEEDVRTSLKAQYAAKHLLPLAKYASASKADTKKQKSTDRIAVIYAEGNVVDGSARGMDRGVYGDDIVKALRDAAKDKSVKAIVLRVNSPGGSATASESMTHAVVQAREQKPVVVSMGDLAASAGYEMSCMADCIVAQPTTITGSIGVFATIPNVGRMLKSKLGLNADTVSTNRNANGLNIMRPLSPTARAMMERNVEDFYKVFVGRVAEGRGMTAEAVQRVARGRVWTGADAKEIGLVDTLGGLDLALSIAAEKAGLGSYRTKEYPKQKDTWAQLAELFGDEPDGDLNLLAKARLAWRWRTAGKSSLRTLSRVEQDLLYVAGQEGVQARLPFLLVAD